MFVPGHPVLEANAVNERVVMDDQLASLTTNVDFNARSPRHFAKFFDRVTSMSDQMHGALPLTALIAVNEVGSCSQQFCE